MGLKEKVLKGNLIEELKEVAKIEEKDISFLIEKIKQGRIVIVGGKEKRSLVGIGEGLSRKINVNIGSSYECDDLSVELEKLKIAEEFGADTVMDLSCSKNSKEIRKKILEESRIPVGTVPVYELPIKKEIWQLNETDFVEAIEEHCKDGVDFMTIHCGLTLEIVKKLKKENKRVLPIVSRGGGILARWMMEKNKENPYFLHFDEIIDIAKEYDVALSLGDALRPGSVCDANDSYQMQELFVISELAKKAHQENISVIIEGPGHIPLNEIKMCISFYKKQTSGMPLYVLGPLGTDIGCGYDHIVGAIGAAFAGWLGADFLCYTTPAEHLHLPSVEDVKIATVSFKIAAHIADVALGIRKAWEKEYNLSKARRELDWEKQKKFSLFPAIFENLKLNQKRPCSMCSSLCPIFLTQSLQL